MDPLTLAVLMPCESPGSPEQRTHEGAVLQNTEHKNVPVLQYTGHTRLPVSNMQTDTNNMQDQQPSPLRVTVKGHMRVKVPCSKVPKPCPGGTVEDPTC